MDDLGYSILVVLYPNSSNETTVIVLRYEILLLLDYSFFSVTPSFISKLSYISFWCTSNSLLLRFSLIFKDNVPVINQAKIQIIPQITVSIFLDDAIINEKTAENIEPK